MTTIAVWNRISGTGKTTTAGNLAAELAKRGTTLLVDCDSQANLTGWLANGTSHELADVLSGDCELVTAVTRAASSSTCSAASASAESCGPGARRTWRLSRSRSRTCATLLPRQATATW